MKQTLRKLGKILFFIVIIFTSCLLLLIGGIWGFQKYKHHQQGKMLTELPKDDTQSLENILNNHMDEKIGDNEMTVEEKLKEGLNPYVADSSGNGISDWDAIYTYQIDPHKFSTADDGVSGYAKIMEGLIRKNRLI